MTPEQANRLVPGIYRLAWTSGGTSVAAVGEDRTGRLWFAPTNWVNVPCFDWWRVESARLLTTQEEEITYVRFQEGRGKPAS